LFTLAFSAFAQQTTTVKGRVMEKGKDISIPFADVVFTGTTVGTVTDENGYFTLTTTQKVSSIRVSFLGYKPKLVPIEYGKKQEITVELEDEGIELQTIEIKYTGNPAEMLIDSARAHRWENDMKRYESYEAESYVKTQFNLYRLTEKFKNQKLLKPFKFIFDNADTVNGEPHYPFLISETLSDIYKKLGTEVKEYIKAANISGVENNNFFQLLGSVYTEFNFYDDNQLVLGKNFIGPLSPVGLTFYKFYLTDTAVIDNHYCYKIELKPRLPKEQIYIGHVWIHDTTFAIKSLHLKMNPEANINIMANFEISVDYKQVNGKWVIDKEIARVDLNPRDFVDFTMNIAPKSENFRIVIIKTSSFKNYKINQPPSELFTKLPDDITLSEEIRKDENYWKENRHDTLTKKEKKIYENADSVKKIPLFKFFYKVGDLVGSGYLDLGWFAIGPVYEMYSYNGLEGHRIRLGGRTGNKVSKRWILEGHVTYGTKDNRWKWDLYSTYHFNKSKNPWRMIGIKAQMDVDQLGLSSTQWRADNFLGSFLRRRSLNDLSYVNKVNIFYEHDWFSGLNNRISFTWFEIYQTPTLRFDRITPDDNGTTNIDKFRKTEIQLETTFAYGQKFLVGRNKRRAVRGRWPTIKFTYAVSIKDVLGSDFTYHNLKFSIYDKIRIKPIGTGFYELAAGKIFGQVPYPFMEIHLGNDTYMADMINSFNIMNYFEFVSDQWFSFKYQHYFDGFFFNKIPGVRKLKLREFMGIKLLMGSISEENKSFIRLPANTYELKHPVTGKHIPYIELNAGIENIFNILYIQFNWRLTYRREADPNNPGQLLFPQAINWGIQGGVFLQL
jgi:hypothetical protein